MEDINIGRILIGIKKYQVAIDFNRRNYETFLLNNTRYPEFKQEARLSNIVVCSYSQSLFEAFQAYSQKADDGNDPPYHHLEEADRLMREVVRENRDFG
eukprot:CAMPEP_0197305644 /NCGR_PEP_ID=MMETSP0891-20130614/1887_1 /TAXON_ID=44058 ORGANISM="Aureoumbra lagunensis, Strain CCMP1510" /NCGR_SAMPLE_ID=MMETSP0891 /ASSEMBLY_ACC=CAM_ASM_000534 /LENGTH=98 /DNA_ID=CAMNT_0042786933 /DNA_START=104 /DNA_END=400 /DNA_ORIENTATION=+